MNTFKGAQHRVKHLGKILTTLDLLNSLIVQTRHYQPKSPLLLYGEDAGVKKKWIEELVLREQLFCYEEHPGSVIYSAPVQVLVKALVGNSINHGKNVISQNDILKALLEDKKSIACKTLQDKGIKVDRLASNLAKAPKLIY